MKTKKEKEKKKKKKKEFSCSTLKCGPERRNRKGRERKCHVRAQKKKINEDEKSLEINLKHHE